MLTEGLGNAGNYNPREVKKEKCKPRSPVNLLQFITHLFIHICYLSSTLVAAGDAAVNKRDTIPVLMVMGDRASLGGEGRLSWSIEAAV